MSWDAVIEWSGYTVVGQRKRNVKYAGKVVSEWRVGYSQLKLKPNTTEGSLR